MAGLIPERIESETILRALNREDDRITGLADGVGTERSKGLEADIERLEPVREELIPAVLERGAEERRVLS